MNSLMAFKFKSVSVDSSYGLWVYIYTTCKVTSISMNLYIQTVSLQVFLGTLMACKFTIITMNLNDMYVYKNLYEHL